MEYWKRPKTTGQRTANGLFVSVSFSTLMNLEAGHGFCNRAT
jgi:hypothetical protein